MEDRLDHETDAFAQIAQDLKTNFDVLPLDAVDDVLKAPDRYPRAVFLMSDDGYANTLTVAADMLEDIKRESVQTSTEMILARAPDVIIELHYGSSPEADRLDRERRVWDALPAVPAVKNRRIYLLVGDDLVVPGPRVPQAAERLARVLHPQAW